ncbi:MAG: hypothetical protein HFH80_10795 [Lachnospiraceae bacterium]|nr:hypothetical protein [Lachnospiraceae bacterium]
MKAIGIDIGTTSICLVLYDQESGRIRESVSAPNHFLEGGFRQDADRIVSVVKEKLDWILEQNIGIGVIGVSAQMHGILYVDREGRAVSPYYTWKEACGRELFEGMEAAEWLSEKSGYLMYPGYGTVTHFVLDKRGEIPAEAVGMVNIGDYLVMRLCGIAETGTDCSIAASVGGFDLSAGDFDFGALKAAGVDTRFYPQIAAAHEAAGFYRGIPVMPAVGDNQASFYAAAGEGGDVVSINVGTGSQVSVMAAELEPIQLGEIRPFTRQNYLYVQASVNGGKVYEKLAAFFEETVELFTGVKIDAYDKLAALELAAEETTLVVAPGLYGTRGENGCFGSVQNLTEENFHPSDLVKAYVTGMARELHQLYLAFPPKLREGRRRIAASGNGIRKNRLLAQEVERLFGMPVTFGVWKEEAAAGAAMLAVKGYYAGTI